MRVLLFSTCLILLQACALSPDPGNKDPWYRSETIAIEMQPKDEVIYFYFSGLGIDTVEQVHSYLTYSGLNQVPLAGFPCSTEERLVAVKKLPDGSEYHFEIKMYCDPSPGAS